MGNASTGGTTGGSMSHPGRNSEAGQGREFRAGPPSIGARAKSPNSPEVRSPLTDQRGGPTDAGQLIGVDLEKLHLGVLRVIKGLSEEEAVAGSAVLVIKRPPCDADVPLSNRARTVCFASTGVAPSQPVQDAWSEKSSFSCQNLANHVVSLAVLLLIEWGLLAFGDPVHIYLGKAWQNGRLGSITVLHLLTHTGGLCKCLPGCERDEKKDLFARVDLLAQTLETEKADSDFHLSCSSDVLACIIEQVTGKKWQNFVDYRVFSPLGMTATKFDGNDTSSMSSTLGDLGRLASSLLNGGAAADGAQQLWSRASLRIITSNFLPPSSALQREGLHFESFGFSPAGLHVANPAAYTRKSLAAETCCWWLSENGVAYVVDIHQGMAFCCAINKNNGDSTLMMRTSFERITNAVYASLL